MPRKEWTPMRLRTRLAARAWVLLDRWFPQPMPAPGPLALRAVEEYGPRIREVLAAWADAGALLEDMGRAWPPEVISEAFDLVIKGGIE
jgi:hypothetical protein